MDKSGMVRTQIGKQSKSLMVAVYGTPCAIHVNILVIIQLTSIPYDPSTLMVITLSCVEQ
jgi:hypothetical protein